MLEKTYHQLLTLARHRNAVRYLALVSFLDASVFPLSPSFMFAPMVLSKPKKVWHYCVLASTASALGGVLGYAMGYHFFEPWAMPMIKKFGQEALLAKATDWFELHGLWALFIAGLSPIPYKIFTISAGVAKLNMLAFLGVSALGRTLRFGLMGLILRWGGPGLEAMLRLYASRMLYVIGAGMAALSAYKYLN